MCGLSEKHGHVLKFSLKKTIECSELNGVFCETVGDACPVRNVNCVGLAYMKFQRGSRKWARSHLCDVLI